MYTMDQELADAAAYAPGRHCVRTHTRWQLFLPSWMCDCKSKIRHRQSIPIQFETRELWALIEEVAPTRKKEQQQDE